MTRDEIRELVRSLDDQALSEIEHAVWVEQMERNFAPPPEPHEMPQSYDEIRGC